MWERRSSRPKCSSSLCVCVCCFNWTFYRRFVEITFDLSRHTRHVFLFAIFCTVLVCFNSFCCLKQKQTDIPTLTDRTIRCECVVFFFFISSFIRIFCLIRTHFPWPGICLCPLLLFFFSLKTHPCRYTKQNDKLYVVSEAHIRNARLYDTFGVYEFVSVCICRHHHTHSTSLWFYSQLACFRIEIVSFFVCLSCDEIVRSLLICHIGFFVFIYS